MLFLVGGASYSGDVTNNGCTGGGLVRPDIWSAPAEPGGDGALRAARNPQPPNRFALIVGTALELIAGSGNGFIGVGAPPLSLSILVGNWFDPAPTPQAQTWTIQWLMTD